MRNVRMNSANQPSSLPKTLYLWVCRVCVCVCVCLYLFVFLMPVFLCFCISFSLSLSRSLSLCCIPVFLCFSLSLSASLSFSLSLSVRAGSYTSNKKMEKLEYSLRMQGREKARKKEDASAAEGSPKGLTFNHVLRGLVLVLYVLCHDWWLLVLRHGINLCKFSRKKYARLQRNRGLSLDHTHRHLFYQL